MAAQPKVWINNKINSFVLSKYGQKLIFRYAQYHLFQKRAKWFRVLRIVAALIIFPLWFHSDLKKFLQHPSFMLGLGMLFCFVIYNPFTRLLYRRFFPEENERNHRRAFAELSDQNLLKFWKIAKITECHIHHEVKPTIGFISLSYDYRDECMSDAAGQHWDPQFFMKWIKKERPEVLVRIERLQTMK